MVEHGTHNPLVVGSSPSGPISPSSRFAAERGFLFGKIRYETYFSGMKHKEKREIDFRYFSEFFLIFLSNCPTFCPTRKDVFSRVGHFAVRSRNSIEIFRQHAEVISLLRLNRMTEPVGDDVRRNPLFDPVVFTTRTQVLERFRPLLQTRVKEDSPEAGVERLAPILEYQVRLALRQNVELRFELLRKYRSDRNRPKTPFLVPFRLSRVDA